MQSCLVAYTVKPTNSGHSRDTETVAVIDRWSLFTGSLTLKRLGYFGSWKNWGGLIGPPLRSRPWIARSPQKFAQW